VLIGDISRLNARRYPDKIAVISGDTRLTWRALDERANRLGTYLLSRGLRPGDRVAVCVRNCAEWPEITYGLAKAGLVLVPLNIRLTAPEVEYIVQDCGARAAIVHTDQAELVCGPLGALEVVLEVAGTSLGKDYELALADGRDLDPTPASLNSESHHVLLYTSGTTGRRRA
jgi:acyl-CoA synthetase (AMP-forming)/AMP-acid ligase II